jgi:hypothetical protein
MRTSHGEAVPLPEVALQRVAVERPQNAEMHEAEAHWSAPRPDTVAPLHCVCHAATCTEK